MSFLYTAIKQLFINKSKHFITRRNMSLIVALKVTFMGAENRGNNPEYWQ